MAKDLNCGDETECKIFKRKLEAMDLKHFAVEKDGHCQFGAVLPHLGEKEFTVMDMRREVTYVLLQILKSKKCDDYDKSLKAECSEMNKSVKDYLKDLYTGKQWGDLITARIISEIYKIKLLLLMRGFDKPYPTAMDKGYTKTVYAILVNNHYTGTEPKQVDKNDTEESEISTTIGDGESVTKVADDMDSTEIGDVNEDAQATSDVDNMVVNKVTVESEVPKVPMGDTNDENDTAECEITPIGDGESVTKVVDDMDTTEIDDVNEDVQATSDADNMVVDEETVGVENEVTSTSSTGKSSKVSTRKRVYNKPDRVYDIVDGIFICKVASCKREFEYANSAYVHHKQVHLTTFKYECKYKDCNKKYNNKTQWVFHQNAHTGKKEHICSECKKAFSRPANLTRHMKVHGNMVVNKETVESEVPKVPMGDTNDENDTAECEITPIGDGESVTKVVDDMDTTEIDDVNEDVQATSDADNMVVDEETVGVENEVTSTSSTGKPSKVSTRKRVYNKPDRVYDIVDGIFICKVASCKREFEYANSAYVHHKQVHLTTFKYECKYKDCNKKYNNKTQWVFHQNAHTGKKEHICPECKKAFSCPGNVNRHMKVHVGK